jgi:hypothetical protein
LSSRPSVWGQGLRRELTFWSFQLAGQNGIGSIVARLSQRRQRLMSPRCLASSAEYRLSQSHLTVDWRHARRCYNVRVNNRGAKAPADELRPDIAVWMPLKPDCTGSHASGLRCTHGACVGRSRIYAATRSSCKGWQSSIPNHLGSCAPPITFKRRRKFANSQPPFLFPLPLFYFARHPLPVPCRRLLPSPTHPVLMFQASPPRPSTISTKFTGEGTTIAPLAIAGLERQQS